VSQWGSESEIDVTIYPSTNKAIGVNTYGDANVAKLLLADNKLWHLFVLGDSRLNGLDTALVANGTGIPFAGMSLISNSNSVTGVNVSKISSASGDANLVPPYTSKKWTGSSNSFEFNCTANTSPYNNTLSNRLTYSNFNLDNVAPLKARLIGKSAKIAAVFRTDSAGIPTSSSIVTPNIAIQLRSTGTSTASPGYYISSPIPTYSDDPQITRHSLTIPSTHDWITYPTPDIGLVVSQNSVMTAGQMFGMSDIWLETSTGICVHNLYSYAGRSTAGCLLEGSLPQQSHSVIEAVYGNNTAYLIGIGTNGAPFGVIQTPGRFISDLVEIIARCRDRKPNAPIILTTSYQASPNSSNNYWLGCIEVADMLPLVLCLDTFTALPAYAAGVTAGYYSDTVHYNSAGQNAYCSKIWQLLAAA